MIKKSMTASLAAAALLAMGQGAQAETVLFVPQDDRPVSLQYTVETAEAAGYTVLTPPKDLISGKNYHGEADQIWNWVRSNASKADVMVLSTDTLVYGGLVDSRKHNIPMSTLTSRVKAIKALKAANPNIPIYGFGTVMRSPRAAGAGTEPDYYQQYGPTIFQIAALQDKLDAGNLSQEEATKLLSLQAQVPTEYLQDWFNRRTENMQVNKALIDEARDNVFAYFALGHDATYQLSQSAMEGRYLSDYAKGIAETKYGSFPGADQLGLLLMARARVDRTGDHPTFEAIYPLGGGAETIPHYEDQTVGKTLAEHVEAMGGTMITNGKPDVLLAVNTPLSKTTGESEAFENFPMISKSTNAFVDRIQDAVKQGVNVSVADIAYSNGSDNTLVGAFYKRDMLYKIGSYNGWNTASNTVGYAIAQGYLSKYMTPQAHKNMLTQQYLDNWAYQANIRKDIYRMQDTISTDNVRYSGELNDKLREYLQERVQDFAEKYLKIDPRTVEASFPWGRLFETDITVYNTPKVPLQREIRLEREKQARIAAAEAERQQEVAALQAANQQVPAELLVPVTEAPQVKPRVTMASIQAARAAAAAAAKAAGQTAAPATTQGEWHSGTIPVTKAGQ